jgi:nicotinamide mononucleotide (NMN) deamidase PncC
VATTVVAGDHSEEGTPPGTVYIATAVGDRVAATEYRFDGAPEQVCDEARRQALFDLIGAMSDG